MRKLPHLHHLSSRLPAQTHPGDTYAICAMLAYIANDRAGTGNVECTMYIVHPVTQTRASVG